MSGLASAGAPGAFSREHGSFASDLGWTRERVSGVGSEWRSSQKGRRPGQLGRRAWTRETPRRPRASRERLFARREDPRRGAERKHSEAIESGGRPSRGGNEPFPAGLRARAFQVSAWYSRARGYGGEVVIVIGGGGVNPPPQATLSLEPAERSRSSGAEGVREESNIFDVTNGGKRPARVSSETRGGPKPEES